MGSSQWRKWIGVTLGLSGLVGCGNGGQELSSLEGSNFLVLVPLTPEAQGFTLKIEVAPQSGCPSVAGMTALVNGHPLELIEAGGRGPGLIPFFSSSCRNPEFSSPKTARELGLDQETSRIELVQGDARRVLEGHGLSARRELKWRGGAGARSPGPGQELLLDLVGPAGDIVRGEGLWAFANFTAETPEASWSAEPTRSVVEGRTFHVFAPREARAARGRFFADVQGQAEITRCEGMEPCQIFVNYRLEQELTPGAP